MHLMYEMRLGMPNWGKRHRGDNELSGDTGTEKAMLHKERKRDIHLRKRQKRLPDGLRTADGEAALPLT